MATLQMLLSKNAKYQDAGTKAWTPGQFVLYANKITWQPAVTGDAAGYVSPIHFGLISITSGSAWQGACMHA
jgi:hypothetical protein